MNGRTRLEARLGACDEFHRRGEDIRPWRIVQRARRWIEGRLSGVRQPGKFRLGSRVEHSPKMCRGRDFHPISGTRVHLQGARRVGYGGSTRCVESLAARDGGLNLAADEFGCGGRACPGRLHGWLDGVARADGDGRCRRSESRVSREGRLGGGGGRPKRLHAVGRRRVKRDGASRIHSQGDYTERRAG